MRLPTLKVYRAFSVLDSVPDEECERYVRRVRTNFTNGEAITPAILAALLCVAWVGGWLHAVWNLNAARYVPMPASDTGRLVLLLASAVLVTGLSGLLFRDAMLWWGLRRELARTSCRKCGFSLRGIPISTVGVDPDPAKSFVRCPECGKKYCLLDVGLSAWELAPPASKDDYARAGQRKKIATGRDY